MQFYHETIQENIAYHKREIQREEAKLKAIPFKSNILWEVATTLKLEPFKIGINFSESHLALYINETMSTTEFELIFDTIEEILASYDFYINIDYTRPSWESRQCYQYVKEADKSTLYVYIHSGVCKQVSTGKMVPETKKDCSFLE